MALIPHRGPFTIGHLYVSVQSSWKLDGTVELDYGTSYWTTMELGNDHPDEGAFRAHFSTGDPCKMTFGWGPGGHHTRHIRIFLTVAILSPRAVQAYQQIGKASETEVNGTHPPTGLTDPEKWIRWFLGRLLGAGVIGNPPGVDGDVIDNLVARAKTLGNAHVADKPPAPIYDFSAPLFVAN